MGLWHSKAPVQALILNWRYRRHWDTNFKRLYKILGDFNATYNDGIKRTSRKCYTLWCQVQYCDLLVFELSNIMQRNMIPALVGPQLPFSEEFNDRRQLECDDHLFEIANWLNQALNYVNDFIQVRIGPNGEENAFMRDVGEKLKSMEIEKELKERLEKWSKFLLDDFSPAEQEQYRARLDTKIIERKRTHRNFQPADRKWTERLQAAHDEPNKTDMKMLYPIVKDINGVDRDAFRFELLVTCVRLDPELVNSVAGEIDKVPGLQYLGPFGIESVETSYMEKNFDFKRAVSHGVYSYKNDRMQWEEGRVSKITDLTVTGDTKKKLKIPEEATKYAFVYPIVNKRVERNTGMLEAQDLVYYFGGYSYLDRNDNLVKLNGLYNGGSDLYFTGPFEFEENSEVIERLREQGRFAQVTIGPLLDAGCVEFCWFMPHEFGAAQHGGFIYIYRSELKFKPNYFVITKVISGKYAQKVHESVERGDKESAKLFSTYFFQITVE